MVWIPVALSRDLPTGVTRAVIVEGQEVVAWRGSAGAVQVWEDRCPHRGMRLSFGFVRENALNCLYHGWQYDAGSRCLKIPAHPDLAVPPTIRANAYAATEAAGMIWTRFDDAADAMPEVEAWTPVASLAVMADAEGIMALCGASRQWRAQMFAAEIDGLVMQIGWHSPQAGQTLLHATAKPGSDVAGALARLRALRAQAEGSVAA